MGNGAPRCKQQTVAISKLPCAGDSAWEPALHTHTVATLQGQGEAGTPAQRQAQSLLMQVQVGIHAVGACVHGGRCKVAGLAVSGHSGQMEVCGFFLHPRGTLGSFNLGVLGN